MFLSSPFLLCHLAFAELYWCCTRPYPRFPLRITPRDASAADFATATKANGQAKGRLGVGLHTASYDGQDPSQWPVEPFAQDLEVQDIDAHQLFRICVKRLRFACEIVLRTRFDEPVRRCHYSVRDRSKIIASGATSDLGVASCELPSGALTFHLEPDVMSPFVATQFDLQVKETGPEPLNFQVETKSVNVDLSLITPDGEPAPFCQFLLKARFTQDGAMSSDDGLSLCCCLRVSFVNASPPQSPSGPHQRVLRSPSPVLVRAPDALRAHSASPPRRMEMSPTMMFRDPRQRSPTDSTLTFDQVEPGRIFQGRSAIDPVASRSRGVPCAAWAHKHPYQTVKMLDSVAEGQESAVSTDIRSPTIQSPRILNRQLVQVAESRPLEKRMPTAETGQEFNHFKPKSEPVDMPWSESSLLKSLPSNPQDGNPTLEGALQEIRQLRQQNQQLLEEKRCLEERSAGAPMAGQPSELAAKNAQLERDARDVLQQFEEFEREKADEVRELQDEVTALTGRLAEKDLVLKRFKADVERERANLLQAMTDESSELQGRVEKLEKDKERLQAELAKALSRIDIFSAQTGGGSSDDGQLRSLQSECEALKDDVTNKDGQIILLRSQLEIADRKLRLSDMENAMLKSELELRKRSSSQISQ
ncbi:unnamed protein product [Effrenium voratum]|nr:unnamed protein product [Effrenium voratum]